MDEIPQPAKLKAPVGAPRQEAAVVWHQLLVARHLLGLPAPTSASASGSAAVLQRPFPHPLSYAASGAAPLPIAGVRPTSSHVSSQSDMRLLVGGPLGGALALSAVAAGAFTFRRRRRTAATAAAADPPS